MSDIFLNSKSINDNITPSTELNTSVLASNLLNIIKSKVELNNNIDDMNGGVSAKKVIRRKKGSKKVEELEGGRKMKGSKKGSKKVEELGNGKKMKGSKKGSKKQSRELPEKLVQFQLLTKHIRDALGKKNVKVAPKYIMKIAKLVRDDVSKGQPNLSPVELTKKSKALYDQKESDWNNKLMALSKQKD